MAEIKLTNILLAFFVCIFILVGGAALVTETFDSYGITDDNKLDQFNSSGLQGNLTDLGYKLDVQDQDSLPSQDDSGFFESTAVGKVLKQIKAIKGIQLSLKNTFMDVLDFVPRFVWWLLGSIVGVLIVMIGIAAWLRYKP